MGNGTLSGSNSAAALPISAFSTAASDAQAEKEFQAEVAASLARAFAEGHSVDNAAVELKTLRMSTNVPLRRVREAVVAGIVDLVPVLPEPAAQRKEIARVVNRWGALITMIGGVDAVETITVLQVCFSILIHQGRAAYLYTYLLRMFVMIHRNIARSRLASASLDRYSPHCIRATSLTKTISALGMRCLSQKVTMQITFVDAGQSGPG